MNGNDEIRGEAVFDRGRKGIDFDGVAAFNQWQFEDSKGDKKDMMKLSLTSFDGKLEVTIYLSMNDFKKLIEVEK